jgi:hypothetical protein
VQLEVNVIRWFCQLVDYPESSGGYLSSGGSMANFTAVFTARRERLPEDFLDGTIYVSDQIHHSVTRAATLAGFPWSAVRTVPVDEAWRIRVDELEQVIAEDRKNGRTPFMIVGSAGTTNTGAIDDLEALADVAEREELWLHLDAAYGGFFVLTDRGRRRMAGIGRADSITLDPHKGLFLPYGTGCLLVRDGGALKRAHSVQADYMPPLQEADDLIDFCEISPELSRDFRGLRAWLPIKMHGLEAFRAALDEKLDLTEWATDELRTQLRAADLRPQLPYSPGSAAHVPSGHSRGSRRDQGGPHRVKTQAGYSGTPLVKKLGIKRAFRVKTANAPRRYRELLTPLPEDVKISSRLRGQVDVWHVFSTSRADLERRLPRCMDDIRQNGMIWASWPKRASGIPSDVSEDVVRELALPALPKGLSRQAEG